MAKRTFMIGVKVTEETKKKIEYIAKREIRPVSTLINIIILEWMEKYRVKNDFEWEEAFKEQQDD